MIKTPNYEIVKKVSETNNSFIYQAVNKIDKKRVILKILKKDYPTNEELNRYLHEYEILKNLNIEGVIKVYKLEKYQNRLILVLEDFEAISLKELIDNRFSIKEILEIFIKISDILINLHNKNIIHKDINPSNILINLKIFELKIIDFEFCTYIPYENIDLQNPNKIEGTLFYISPEQTGRINRGIDYRSDLYSLGVTFYEFLTKKLPFYSTNPIELVHSHIAKIPIYPNLIDTTIPTILSKIIMKLLSKNPEERYQSAYGLKSDLMECLNQLNENKNLNDLNFKLAQSDLSEKFAIPQKLYGREYEIRDLLNTFERVNYGNREIVFITGYSGVGKSSLVNELLLPLTKSSGYFAFGKFNQYSKDIPYLALTGAFNEFCHYILAENDLSEWRKKILKAVGVNGQVLIDVIPALELIIGKQPKVKELSPKETQNRFNLIFQNFIKILSSPTKPFILFIDDWQWADLASLTILKEILSDSDIKSFLIIGTYRDNEVDNSHPLMITLNSLRENHILINTIRVKNLTENNLNSLIADTLHSNEEKTKVLTKLIYEKTKGNAFFSKNFLTTLYKEKLLTFNYNSRCWQWDIEKIANKNITDNVVELITLKIQKLNKITQDILQICACIGNQFELELIEKISQKDRIEIKKELTEALKEGFIISIENRYKFTHDRIEQAIYSMIDENKRVSLHATIGKILLSDTKVQIFKIVDQLNSGVNRVNLKEIPLAKLNFEAGVKAKNSSAYKVALNYFDNSLKLLSENCWQKNYDFILKLYLEKIEVEYLSGNLKEIDKLVNIVEDNAKNTLDKIKAYEVQIQALIAQNEFQKALNEALLVLNFLNINLTSKPNMFHILLGIAKTKFLLFGITPNELLLQKEMSDNENIVAMRILMSVIPAAYFANPKLYPLIVFKMVELSLKYGNSAESTYAYVAYGIILYGVLGDIENGYSIGEVGSNLLDKLDSAKLKATTMYSFNAHLKHSKFSMRELLPTFLNIYKIGLENGDLAFASYSLLQNGYTSIFCGVELHNLEKKLKNHTKAINKIKQQSVNYNKIFHQFILNLLKKDENLTILVGKVYNEYEMLPIHEKNNDKTGLFFLYFCKMVLNYLFSNFNDALNYSKLAESYVDAVIGISLVQTFYFFYSLILISHYENISKEMQKEFLTKIKQNQKKMKKWAKYAPMNNLHKYYLIEAELSRVLKSDKARDFYDKAIDSASKNEYLNELALSYELAGKFYIQNDSNNFAQFCFQNAHYNYSRWGALAKCEELEVIYPDFFTFQVEKIGKSINNNFSISNSFNKSTNLDLATIIKASQTISSEVMLNSLLEKMMEIVIENAGADKGILLLFDNGKWFIEAKSDINNNLKLLKSIPLESYKSIAKSVIYYVERTRQSLLLNESNKNKFIHDNYILKENPKSLLSIPLINRGNLKGILYLENNQTSKAFIIDRVEIIELLSTQMAISLENALLYSELENKVIERTSELYKALQDLQKAQNQIMDSIEYASLIQNSFLPKDELIAKNSNDYFIIWEPRDIVGGDIYLFKEFENGFLSFVIDCTGHGIPGAFMTMIVGTSIEYILNKNKKYNNPALILKELNATIKKTLKQDMEDTKSDDGFDASVIYYNKLDKKLSFAGANSPLFYIQHNQLKILKGDRVSLGYKKSNINFEFQNREITIDRETYLYLTTDGLVTQQGGKKNLMFGNKRLKELLMSNYKESFAKQKEIILNELKNYQKNRKRNDDITLLAIKLDNQ